MNPLRELATVSTISTGTWKGVNSAGVTAAFSDEATEQRDNAPTLAQPSITTQKAQAFVPFSIEVGQDYMSLQAGTRQPLRRREGSARGRSVHVRDRLGP